MGGCLCSCGQLLHGAAPVTRGVRYVLIAFIDEQQLPPDDSDADEHDGPVLREGLTPDTSLATAIPLASLQSRRARVYVL